MSELPESAQHLSRAELRKAIVRLRLEMQRQQLKRESDLLLRPLKSARDIGQSLRGSTPLWAGAGGAAALALLLGKRRWIRLLRIGIALAPLLLQLRKPRSETPPPS
ncbi:MULTISPECIES: hypothetical protein [Pseudomonas]|uniref:hypothetical protein n=1 Tax=Pseudomonas TaxID=286 RepID=UPI0023D8704C|nr:hypothetical protein [Pseudomonas sp. PSE14]WEJ73946.1 hypothetical protein O6P39_08775 [Pseudomonas sp. PSE14]